MLHEPFGLPPWKAPPSPARPLDVPELDDAPDEEDTPELDEPPDETPEDPPDEVPELDAALELEPPLAPPLEPPPPSPPELELLELPHPSAMKPAARSTETEVRRNVMGLLLGRPTIVPRPFESYWLLPGGRRRCEPSRFSSCSSRSRRWAAQSPPSRCDQSPSAIALAALARASRLAEAGTPYTLTSTRCRTRRRSRWAVYERERV
jgi:hypothetical protein